jgi:hypothetical protein
MVLFLHSEKVKEFYPLRGFGILRRDQFPQNGCRSGETPSIVNGTPGKVQYLCTSNLLGTSSSKILGTQHREKFPPKPCCPVTGVI